jgi:hypothetical protein
MPDVGVYGLVDLNSFEGRDETIREDGEKIYDVVFMTGFGEKIVFFVKICERNIPEFFYKY